MQPYEIIYQQIVRKLARTVLIVTACFAIVFSGCVILYGLYADRLNDSRLITNCESFSSYSAMIASYRVGNKKLDSGNRNGIPCEKQFPHGQ